MNPSDKRAPASGEPASFKPSARVGTVVVWALAFILGPQAPVVARAGGDLVPAAVEADLAASTGPAPSEDVLLRFRAIGSDFVVKNEIQDMGWTQPQLAAFLEGIEAAVQGRPYAMDEQARQLYEEMQRKREKAAALKIESEFAQPARLAKYLKDVRKKMSLQQSDSGLCYKINAGGQGSAIRPRLQDKVVVTLSVGAYDGKAEFPHLHVDRGKVRVADLLPGVAEAIQMMPPGSKAILVVPPQLSYAGGTWPEGVTRGTPLFFLVELHEIIAPDAAP